MTIFAYLLLGLMLLWFFALIVTFVLGLRTRKYFREKYPSAYWKANPPVALAAEWPFREPFLTFNIWGISKFVKAHKALSSDTELIRRIEALKRITTVTIALLILLLASVIIYGTLIKPSA
jgi:hypothetical protein